MFNRSEATNTRNHFRCYVAPSPLCLGSQAEHFFFCPVQSIRISSDFAALCVCVTARPGEFVCHISLYKPVTIVAHHLHCIYGGVTPYLAMNIAHLFIYFVVFFVWYPYFVEMCHPAFRSCGNDCQYPVGVSESELGSEHRVLLNMHLMRAHLRYFIFVQCVVCCMYSGSAPFIYKYQSVRVKEEHSVLGSYMPARFTHICIING